MRISGVFRRSEEHFWHRPSQRVKRGRKTPRSQTCIKRYGRTLLKSRACAPTADYAGFYETVDGARKVVVCARAHDQRKSARSFKNEVRSEKTFRFGMVSLFRRFTIVIG